MRAFITWTQTHEIIPQPSGSDHVSSVISSATEWLKYGWSTWLRALFIIKTCWNQWIKPT